MIVSFWQEHLDEFLELMQEQQFCSVVINRHRKFAQFLMEQANESNWQTYDDICNYYSSKTELTTKYRWRVLSAIKKMKAFHLSGEIPFHKVDKNHMSVPVHSKGNLDFFSVQERMDEFLDCFETENYSDSIITEVRRILSRVIVLSRTIKWNSYHEVKEWFAAKDIGKEQLYNICAALDKLECWQKHGTIPVHSSIRHPLQSVEPSRGELDLSYLQKQMDAFLSLLKANGYSAGTADRTQAVLSRIIVLARRIKWDSFQEIRDWYLSQDIGYSYQRLTQSVINKAECFLNEGNIPKHPSILKKLQDTIRSKGELDLTYLQEHLSELTDFMKEHGYSEDYMKKVNFTAHRIVILSRDIALNSYGDIWEWYNTADHRNGYLHDVRSILGILAEYHLQGVMPNNRETQNPLCIRGNAYSRLVPEFRELVDFSCTIEKQKGLKESSVRCTRTKAASFLLFLQGAGEDTLEKVTESCVLSFFHQDGKYLRGQSTAARILIFFRNCIPVNPIRCRQIMMYIPKFHSSRKTIQYLTSEECDKFRNALKDSDNNLSYKARTIGSVVFYTGMRSSDISNLTLESIDLKHQTISFEQEKTGGSVVLPLSTVVGNAIYDYCVSERPDTDSRYLFVGDMPPYNKLGKGGIAWAVSNVMKAAGIRQESGDRKGTHIFRHRAASTMASKNIPSPVISATLGHSSPKALDSYLYADMDHLKECALSLEKYPLAKEVFDRV